MTPGLASILFLVAPVQAQPAADGREAEAGAVPPPVALPGEDFLLIQAAARHPEAASEAPGQE